MINRNFNELLTGLLCFMLMIIPSFNIKAAEALSLESLIQQAIKNNPEVLAAKKRWEASKSRIPQAKSLEDPTVNIKFEKIQKGTIKLDRTMPEDRIISVSQMLPFIGKLPLKGKIALIESQMYAAEYKDKELEIINSVKNAFYDLFLNHKKTELTEENLIIMEELSKIVEVKYTTEQIEQEEVLKINIEIAKLSNNIQNFKQERIALEENINGIINQMPEHTLGVPVLEEKAVFNKEAKDLYSVMLDRQPELSIFSYAIEKNKAAKDLASRSVFPDVMTEVAFRGITSGRTGPWDLMLSFTVPFWFWSKQRYEIKEAIANVEEATAAYEAMKNKAFSQVKALTVKIQIAKNKINLNKNNLIPLLESSLNMSLSSYRSGSGNIMRILDNQRMLIETKIEYYRALIDFNIGVSDLEKMVGMDISEEKNEK
ncbi:MAG: TolC family protein [Candidatus Omnitrophota bacterium]